MICPTIIFGGEPQGTSIPVLPNMELKHGAFCVINPNFWGVENPMIFNGTMNYTEVSWCQPFLTLTELNFC